MILILIVHGIGEKLTKYEPAGWHCSLSDFYRKINFVANNYTPITFDQLKQEKYYVDKKKYFHIIFDDGCSSILNVKKYLETKNYYYSLAISKNVISQKINTWEAKIFTYLKNNRLSEKNNLYNKYIMSDREKRLEIIKKIETKCKTTNYELWYKPLNWDQIHKEFCGISILNHTENHDLLNYCSKDECTKIIGNNILEEIRFSGFVLPCGKYDDNSIEEIVKSYNLIFSAIPGINSAKTILLKRIDINNLYLKYWIKNPLIMEKIYAIKKKWK